MLRLIRGRMLSFTYEGLSHISKKKQGQELGVCRNQDSPLLLKRKT